MKKMRIAINGFGRIGRQFFKIATEEKSVEIIAVNDLGDFENLSYLLEFDSVYGHYDKKIDKKITFLQEADPSKLPWKDLDIDVVIESTGRFTSYEKASAHLKAGAKRVVLSAPVKDNPSTSSGQEVITVTPNINEKALAKSKITTNASCTTNAITPLVSILNKKPGIKYALLNTVHGYTAGQNLVDGPAPSLRKDFRRGRAAAMNIVPTSTGAARATAKAIPNMLNKFDGLAIRVPVAAGSILDFTFVAEKKTSREEINEILAQEAKKAEWEKIFAITTRPLVSSDILKNPHGAIADLSLTRVVGGKLVKVMVWYDNEWGYSNMLLRHVLALAPLLK